MIMKIYNTKSKMFGYKIGLNNSNIYVAVPKKYLDGPKMDGTVLIKCDNKERLVTENDICWNATFDDKFKPGTQYTLCYFLWEKRDD